MQILSEGFRQAVGNRFDHDFVVIIMLRFVCLRQRILFKSAGYRKGADIVGFATQFRCDEIRQTVVGEAHFLRLLTQVMAHGQHMRAGFIAVDFHIVTHAVRREQPHHAARIEGFLCTQRVEHVIGIFKQPLRLFTNHLILEDARIFARQRPGHEERRPVNVVTQRFDAGGDVLHAQTMRNRRGIARPVKRQIVIARRLK